MASVNLVRLSEAVTNNRFSAEFFDPRYVFEPAAGAEWSPIGRVLKKCEYGLSISMNSVGKGYPIFRMNELEGCFALRPGKFANISQSEFNANALQENDVLFNRTNSFEFVGRTGIVKDQTDCTFASYLIRLVPDTSRLLPEFLTVYLNTPFGIGQIKRRAMRSINQANVSGSEVRKILIPLVDLSKQKEVANLVNAAFTKQRDGLSYHATAQSLMETGLRLDKLTDHKPMGYVAHFSDLESSHRLDAQHYQPRFKQLIDHLSGFSLARVRDIRSLNRRGLQPVYLPNGDFDVVNSQHLGSKHIDYQGLEKTSEKSFAAAPAAHIQPNDLLIYTTGAYIGRTNVYLSDAPAMASNHVNILRLQPDIDAAYMALVFQSIVGQFQTQQHARGSAQAELYPSDIDRYVVPMLAIDKQRAIGDLVRASLMKQQESQLLLAQAKARVIQFIEEAIKP
jgi:type I restriction enzyme S subunit